MKRFLETLTAWEGAVRGDAVHKQIVDAYNSYLPHPRGYRLTYSDDYCAATRARRSASCKSFLTLAAMSWMWITPSAPRRKGRGESTSPRTFSRP